jgi:hypothetical protein
MGKPRLVCSIDGVNATKFTASCFHRMFAGGVSRGFFLVSQTMEHTFYTNFSLMQICRNYRVIPELQTKSCVDALLNFEQTRTKYEYKVTTQYNLLRASWTAKVTHIFL